MSRGIYLRTSAIRKKQSLTHIGNRHSEETKRKISLNSNVPTGKNHPNWKNGRIKRDGYIHIKKPTHPFNNCNYVREHRLIVEKQIGRYLHRWEIVHHANKIRDDNRPQNLIAFKGHSAHAKFERGFNIDKKDIIFDGRKISSHPSRCKKDGSLNSKNCENLGKCSPKNTQIKMRERKGAKW